MIRLRTIRRVRRWMTILLIAVTTITLFSLNMQQDEYDSDSGVHLRDISSMTADISYCAGQDNQYLDLYTPISSVLKAYTTPYPLAIYIHGGGWQSGDKRNSLIDYYGTGLLSNGFAVASINYRLAPKNHYPAQNNDIACAVQKLASIATARNLNTSHVILIGDSAGGLLASDYALSNDKKPITVDGVVSFYGTTDLVSQLTRTKKNPDAYRYLGTKSTATAKLASPLYQKITDTPPPFLFFHGTKDSVVPIDQSKKLYELVKEYQPSSKFIQVTNAGHGFAAGGHTTQPSSDSMRRTLIQFVLKCISSNKQAEPAPSQDQIILDNN